MLTSKCWYEDVCDLYSDNCKESCIRYKEMSFMISRSNIPENRQFSKTLHAPKCDYSAFCKLATIKDNIAEFVADGKNLYITSESTGNGKTTWAIKLMLKYFDVMWAGNGFKERGLFIHVPTFLLKCKDFGNKDPDFERMKELLPEIDLVIWDDIASTELSAYDYSQLLMYLDVRISDYKSNIFTGNVTNRDNLQKALASKLTSRIWSNNTEVITFKGEDRR